VEGTIFWHHRRGALRLREDWAYLPLRSTAARNRIEKNLTEENLATGRDIKICRARGEESTADRWKTCVKDFKLVRGPLLRGYDLYSSSSRSSTPFPPPRRRGTFHSGARSGAPESAAAMPAVYHESIARIRSVK